MIVPINNYDDLINVIENDNIIGQIVDPTLITEHLLKEPYQSANKGFYIIHKNHKVSLTLNKSNHIIQKEFYTTETPAQMATDRSPWKISYDVSYDIWQIKAFRYESDFVGKPYFMRHIYIEKMIIIDFNCGDSDKFHLDSLRVSTKNNMVLDLLFYKGLNRIPLNSIQHSFPEIYARMKSIVIKDIYNFRVDDVIDPSEFSVLEMLFF